MILLTSHNLSMVHFLSNNYLSPDTNPSTISLVFWLFYQPIFNRHKLLQISKTLPQLRVYRVNYTYTAGNLYKGKLVGTTILPYILFNCYQFCINKNLLGLSITIHTLGLSITIQILGISTTIQILGISTTTRSCYYYINTRP